jgi:hypothetical protein
LAIGFVPSGKEPGLCPTIIKHKEQPGNPPPPPNPNNPPPGITIP